MARDERVVRWWARFERQVASPSAYEELARIFPDVDIRDFIRFDRPGRAIACAQEIVGAVRPLGIEVRAGLRTGECEIVEGKCSGLSVSIGARVMAHAGASEILVSQTVKDLTAGSGVAFEDAGEHELKGVPDRWHLYRVESGESTR